MINWRIYLIGGLLAAMWAGSMYVAHLQTKVRNAEKAKADAEAQVIVTEGTAQAVDRVTLTERRITNEVYHVEKQIEALPSGDALVPDDVAAVWADGIDRLRLNTAEPTGDNSREPEGLPR